MMVQSRLILLEKAHMKEMGTDEYTGKFQVLSYSTDPDEMIPRLINLEVYLESKIIVT